MGSMVTNVYVDFNYNRLRIDKALGNLGNTDNTSKNKNNVRGHWGPYSDQKLMEWSVFHT